MVDTSADPVLSRIKKDTELKEQFLRRPYGQPPAASPPPLMTSSENYERLYGYPYAHSYSRDQVGTSGRRTAFLDQTLLIYYLPSVFLCHKSDNLLSIGLYFIWSHVSIIGSVSFVVGLKTGKSIRVF